MKILLRKSQILKTQHLWHDPTLLLKGTLRSFRTMVLLAILLTFGCLVYLWQWMNFLEKSYEVQRLEKDHQQMIVRLEMLRVEADYLSRPQRLETVAINQMQMRLPNPTQLYQSETLFSDEVSHP